MGLSRLDVAGLFAALTLFACGKRFGSADEGVGGGLPATTTVTSTTTGGGDGGQGGMAGSGGGVAVTCPAANGVELFTDRFDDGMIAPEWALYGEPSSTGVRNGFGYISLGLTDAATYLYTPTAYTFIGCEASVRILATPTCDGCESSFAVIDANNGENFLWIAHQDGTLYFEEFIGNSLVDSKELNLTASGNYWRIREANGNVQFAVSHDGLQWSAPHSSATPQWAGSVQLELHASGRTESGEQEFQFDDVNVLP